MNPLLKDIYKTGAVEDADGNRINPFPSSIAYQEGISLYKLIRKIRPAHTLEIGMAYGLSTLFLCQALSDNGSGQHSAIDPLEHSQWHSIGLLNIKKAKLDSILNFYNGFSWQVLSELIKNNAGFGFAFVDGVHYFEYLLVDFFLIDKLLPVGGYIMFHDLWLPSVRKVVKFILRNQNYRLIKEPSWNPLSPLERVKRTTNNLARNHWQGYRVNYCLIQKTAPDNRKEHNHFCNF